METIQIVYIALAVIFAGVMAYMYLYTTHLHPKERSRTSKAALRSAKKKA